MYPIKTFIVTTSLPIHCLLMNILITSVGRCAYMVSYFKDALKGNGKIHAANSIETYAMLLADESVITPTIYDHACWC